MVRHDVIALSMLRLRVLAFVVLAAALLVGCSKSNASSSSSSSGTGEGASAKRIVSISPSTTEAVFAVGAGSQLVGRSRYCDFPPEVAKLPQVGGYVDPSYEAILALRPDLVTGARGPAGNALAEKLSSRGIATYFPETESFAAIGTMILGMAERTGRAQEGRTAVDGLHERIASIEKAVGALPKTRVLLVFGLAPLSVAGPSSFANEMIRRAGGANVVTEGGTYPTMGAERVLALDPDVIVNCAMMEERVSERFRKDAPEWSHVRAIQTDRVVSITNEAVLRPGPRIADGLALIAHAIHPDAKLPMSASAPSPSGSK
jgi:iron complex transport system substrate-binding protein